MGKPISLKAARVDKGYTQEDAAKLMGVGKDTIRNWEKGKTKISASNFQKLCSIYERSQADIFLP